MKKWSMLIFSLLLLTGCSQHNTSLEKAVGTIVEEEKKNEINIEELADFEWDKGFLFAPYTPQKTIEEQLGVEFKDPSNLSSREDIYLLVFMNNDEVVQYAEIKRQKASFSIGEKSYLTPSNASIKIERYETAFLINSPAIREG